MEKTVWSILDAKPICPVLTDREDAYFSFRHEFLISQTVSEATLEISAYSTFELQLNGQNVPVQQLADYPEARTFSRFDVAAYLIPGVNRITVCIHSVGTDFLTCRDSVPYLQMILFTPDTVLARTDESWLCSTSTPYRSQLKCRTTPQLGFVFEYDACKEDCFTPGQTITAPVSGTLELRKVPQLKELPHPETSLRGCGIIKRRQEEESSALNCMRDFAAPYRIQELFASYPDSGTDQGYIIRKKYLRDEQSFVFKPLSEFPGADGYFVIADLGAETEGYLTFTLETDTDGVVLDISHGEHLDDGRVRAYIDGRCFADRYICHKGLNRFTFRHRRLGARYLEMHMTHCAGSRVTLHYLGMIPLELPLPEAADFQCEDSAIVRHNQLAINTLKLCMHEHYEDCPWREQGLYAYDSRNQMLFGYYVWGNYDFAAASLDLLGSNFDGERYLGLTAPGRLALTIPIFTMAWITAVYEHILFSGSDRLFVRWQEQIDRILDAALADRVPGFPELCRSCEGKEIWNFCEWQGELSQLNRQPQSIYNLYLAEALRAAGQLHEYKGNTERAAYLNRQAETIENAVKEVFRDDARHGFLCSLPQTSETLYEHVQALMLALVPLSAEDTALLLDQLTTGSMQPISLSAYPYLLRGFLKAGTRGEQMILPRLRKTFDPILFSGATSLWETTAGSDDFGAAGSLCHAWSGLFPYFSGRVLLGVRPLSPGFRTFEVNPVSCGLTHAEGEIPTPSGKIRVRWQRNAAGKLDVTVQKPDNLQCIAGKNVASLQLVKG